MTDKEKLSKEDMKKVDGGNIFINNEYCPTCHVNLLLSPLGKVFCPICGWTR